MLLLDRVVLRRTEVAQGLPRQVAALSLELQDVLDGGFLIGQVHLPDLHLLLVLEAQLAARVAVEDEVPPFPDEQRVAATFLPDARLLGVASSVQKEAVASPAGAVDNHF